jgi:hypothetical protein
MKKRKETGMKKNKGKDRTDGQTNELGGHEAVFTLAKLTTNGSAKMPALVP